MILVFVSGCDLSNQPINCICHHQSLFTCMMESFEYAFCIRGYHVYQSRWIPIEGDVLCCVQETDNTEDIEAVAVKKKPNLDVLGHIPKYFNKFVFRFLQRSIYSASAKITGKPVDREAGFGMEVLRLYEFRGDSFSKNWVGMKIEGNEKCIDEACKTGDKGKNLNSLGLCACHFTTYKNWELFCFKF